MTKFFGRAFRFILIVFLSLIAVLSTISLFVGTTRIVLTIVYSVAAAETLLSIISIISFFPLVALCALLIVMVSLQIAKTIKIEKFVLKADNLPNDYNFEIPSFKKQRGEVATLVIISSVIAIAFLLCISIEYCLISTATINIISAFYKFFALGMESYEIILVGLDTVLTVLFLLVLIFIQISSIIGIMCFFIGNRRREANELERTLKQKSHFAKIRKMEENDEVDDISKLF